MTSTPSESRPRSDRLTLHGLIVLAVVVWVMLFFVAGCASTITPEVVSSGEASYDGNVRTSGVIRSLPNGFLVTDNFRARYNGMIAIYGGDFIPRLKIDQDIVPIGEDRWIITKQGMVNFLEMNAWRKSALKPLKP